MTSIEKKARKYVKGLYFDYKCVQTYDEFKTYYAAMMMLENLFPDSTDEEALERAWNIEWRKKEQ